MPIVPSSARRIQELIGKLGSERAAVRESAVARLTLLGPRVLEALLAALPTAGNAARLAALELLERLREPRTLPEILALAQSADARVAARALEVLGSFPHPKAVAGLAKSLEPGPLPRRRAAARALVRLQAWGMVEATDPLLDLLMDEHEDDELRLFVLEGLAALEPPLDSRTLVPLLKRLRGSADATVADRAEALLARTPAGGAAKDAFQTHLDRARTGGPADVERAGQELARLGKGQSERLERELERTSDPALVRALADALGRVGGASSIPVLGRALERLSQPDRRRAAADGAGAGQGTRPRRPRRARQPARPLRSARDAAGAARSRPGVAARGRRLRGDATVVPALVALAAESPALLEVCAAPFAAIARRTRLRRTSAVLKSIRPEHREALAARSAARRSAGP